MAKKKAKKATKLTSDCATNKNYCHCEAILAILIIVLIWLPSVATTWSRVLATVAAALILISTGHCVCHKDK